jgi:hypothetical protein
MADQVSVAENIARVSTAGFELAQQLYELTHSEGAEEKVRCCGEELGALRVQLQNLDMLLATMSDDSGEM